MSDIFTDSSPLRYECSSQDYKKGEDTLYVETSNYKRCSTCNKSKVCKYQEIVKKDVEKIITLLRNKEIPLSININCREWEGSNSGLVR